MYSRSETCTNNKQGKEIISNFGMKTNSLENRQSIFKWATPIVFSITRVTRNKSDTSRACIIYLCGAHSLVVSDFNHLRQSIFATNTIPKKTNYLYS